MATNWILGKVSDALAPTVSSACASAGTFAGGAMNTVGSGINGVGETINTSIRYYGDGAKDYGNSIMDWSKAPGTRAQTASNPLGLSGSTGGGKAKATSPSIYRAPAKPKKEVVSPSKPKGTQKKVVDVPKSAPASSLTAKPRPKIEPTKKISPLKAAGPTTKAPAVPYVDGVAKGVTGKVDSTAAAVTPKIPAKAPAATSKANAKGPAKKDPAKNPLGLSF